MGWKCCWVGYCVYCSFSNVMSFSLSDNTFQYKLGSGWKTTVNTRSGLYHVRWSFSPPLTVPRGSIYTGAKVGLNPPTWWYRTRQAVCVHACMCTCACVCIDVWYTQCDVMCCTCIYRWRVMPSTFVPQQSAKGYSPTWRLSSQI